MTPLIIEEGEPFQFNFAFYGLIPGAYIQGRNYLNDDVSGRVEAVYPKFVVLRKKNGMCTTIHMGHLISRKREVNFKIVGQSPPGFSQGVPTRQKG